VVAESGAGIAVSPTDEAGVYRALVQLVAGGFRRSDIDRSLYDGALRAAELGAILHGIACNRQVEDTRSPAVPISTEPS